eukprot:scaffold62347_cov28-Tisochrysis_lutea.AAC.5
MDTRSLAGTNMTGGTRRTAASAAASTTGRLNALADDFNNFYGDLEEETKIRKQAEEKRVARLELELGKVERVIRTETKRRIEASKALQVRLERLVEGGGWGSEIESRLREREEPRAADPLERRWMQQRAAGKEVKGGGAQAEADETSQFLADARQQILLSTQDGAAPAAALPAAALEPTFAGRIYYPLPKQCEPRGPPHRTQAPRGVANLPRRALPAD